MDKKVRPNKGSNACMLEWISIQVDTLSPLQVYCYILAPNFNFIRSHILGIFLAGSLCEWKHKTVDKWMESETFEDYMKTLILECESNREQPANLTWTVPIDAPNTLYYQVVQ